jgi:Na+-transporting methylmalonyl-CoA/oxaloacetate decarboxylase gamma subunit
MWPEAVTIILNGFLVVCFIMGLLAAITWAVGKVVQRIEEEAKEE